VELSRFVEGCDRRQPTLLPECLDDYVAEENPVRVVDVFVDEMDLASLGFEVMPAATGRPAYHPAMLLKLYVYGYLNKVQSSRRLEREARRNVELMWLTGRLAPDHKTIADFRKDNGPAIQAACAQFVVLCRQIGLFGAALAAIDGSKFKAVNTRDKNFTANKLKKRLEQVAGHIAGYLRDLDTADRQEGEAAETRSERLKEKVERLREQMRWLQTMEAKIAASPDGQVSLTDPDARSMATSGRGSGMVGYNVQSAVDADQSRDPAQRRAGTVSSNQRRSSGVGPGVASEAMQAGLPSRPGQDRIRQAATQMVALADRRLAQTHLARGAAQSGVARNHLPQPVHPDPRGAEEGTAGPPQGTADHPPLPPRQPKAKRPGPDQGCGLHPREAGLR
jgi:transposase